MPDRTGPDNLLSWGVLVLGLGLVSLPFTGPRVGLQDSATASGATGLPPQACPSGLGVEPHCFGEGGRDTSRAGTALLRRFYGLTAGAPLDQNLACGTRVMVAFLPDPIESHLATSFDAFLYALSRAHEKAGYGIDRFWLPWDAAIRAGEKDTASIQAAAVSPGVLLFRRLGQPLNSPTVSLVYLVGETPTQGINQVAFKQALIDLTALRTACPDSTLRVIGPYFSGSAQSLFLALDAVKKQIPHALLYSGSATAFGNERLRNDQITFTATVHSDSAYRTALSRVIQQLGIPSRRTARITEQATAYGQSLTAQDSRSDSVLDVTLPMNLGTIRSAYDDATGGTRAAGSQDQLELGPRVGLNEREQTRFHDVIPTLSQVTVATQEIFLDQIARILAQREIQLVGLQATDVRDKLFLARELHRRLPHLWFYTFESNELYLRPDYEGALIGTLVFSTYPLIPDPTASGGAELFPSDPAAGVYNATLLLLERPELVNYSHSLVIPPDSLGHPARRSQLPLVWLTVVGSGAFEPIAVNEGADTGYVETAQGRAAKSSQPRPHPLLRSFLFLAGVLVSWSPVARLAKAVIRTTRVMTAPIPADGARPPKVGSLAAWRHRLAERLRENTRRWVQPTKKPADEETAWFLGEARIFAGLARLGLTLTILPAIVLTVDPAVGRYPMISARYGFAALALIPVIITFVVFVLDLARLQRTYLWTLLEKAFFAGVPEVVLRLVIYGCALGFLIGSLGFTLSILRLDPRPAELFWARAQALSVRTSPILPLLLIGGSIAAWCMWHRYRARLLSAPKPFEELLTRHPFPPAGSYGTSWNRVGNKAAEFRYKLALLTPNGHSVGVMMVVLIVAAIIWWNSGSTIETLVSPGLGWTFRWLLWFGLMTAFALTVISVDRLLSLWRSLQDFLKAVEELPIRTAFDRLPPQLARLTRLVPSASPKEMWQACQDHHWRQLVNLAGIKGSGAEHDPDSELDQAAAAAIHATSEPERLLRIEHLLDEYWRTEPTTAVVNDVLANVKELKDLHSASDPTGSPLSSKFRRSTPDRWAMWVRAAEEYFAAEIVEYIDWAVDALRWVAMLLVGMVVCITLIFYSYPIPQERMVRLAFFTVVLVTIFGLGWTMAQMNRNDLLSRITRTTPGRITWNRSFVMNLAVLVGIPLLSYIGSAMPELRSLLFGWVDPVLRVFSR